MLRATTRLVILIVYTFFTVTVGNVLNRVVPYAIHRRFLQYWYRFMLRLLGFHIHLTGTIPPKSGLLIVSNHCSYIDILVIGSLLPVHFTPKSTIKRWPLICHMVNVSQPIYIDRNDRRAMHTQNERLAQALTEGKNIVLYPEGTTNTGICVYPFKTGFFACLETSPSIPVLPVSIIYASTDSYVLNARSPSPVAWYGDMTLLPHLWALLKRKQTEIHIQIHPTVTLDQFPSRKALAAHCEEIIRQDMLTFLS